jgi:FkbM family methyltransferase
MSERPTMSGKHQTAHTITLDETLQLLQSELRPAMIERESTTFDRISAPFTKSIVLFGAGPLGRFTLNGLRSVGIRPLAFADNNPALWGNRIDGLEVHPPHQAIEQYGDKAVFVVTIYNGTATRVQLRSLFCQRVVPFVPLFWKYAEVFVPSSGLELPHRIMDQVEDIKQGYAVLSDEASRREFCEQLRWRVLLNLDCLALPEDKSEIYFPSDLVVSMDREIFIDCGAFDGDSIRSFMSYCKAGFSHIYAVEPDSTNRMALQGFVDNLPGSLREKIAILPYAVGRTNGKVSFNAGKSAASGVSAQFGTDEVECRRLDTLMSSIQPTYIKMDTEGAELDAILGAAYVLKHSMPVLAACVYHRCEHLWQIPAMVHSISPDHGVYLRRYAEDCWELVCYAVPANRLGPSLLNTSAERRQGI